MQTLTINGSAYEVISTTSIPNFRSRVGLLIKKLNGRVLFHVVHYDDGTFSSVTRSPVQ